MLLSFPRSFPGCESSSPHALSDNASGTETSKPNDHLRIGTHYPARGTMRER